MQALISLSSVWIRIFNTMITKAGLKKEEFKTVDKEAFTCNKYRITLDKQVDTSISFEDNKFTLLFM